MKLDRLFLCNCTVLLTLLTCPVKARGQDWGSLFGGSQSNNQSQNQRSNRSGARGYQSQNSGQRRVNNDFADGPSGPPKTYIPGGGGSSKPKNEFDWGAVVIDALDTAAAIERNNRNNYDRSYPRPAPYPNRSYPSRNYGPPVEREYRPAPAAVRSNTLPTQKFVALRDNTASLADQEGFQLADDEEKKLFAEVGQKQAKEDHEDLKDGLGDAADHPDVEKELDRLEEKIENGEPLTDEDMKSLTDAVNQAQTDGKTINVTPDDYQKLLEDQKKSSEVSAALNDAAESSTEGMFPVGETDVVTMPGLPADDMVMLGDGCVVMGAGDGGQMGMTTVDAAELVDVPVGLGEPIPDSEESNAQRVKTGTLLMNPESNGVTIEYVVANQNYSMQPKYTQHLADGRSWVIEFDRGENFGTARYSLSAGTYLFTTTERGWDLHRRKFNVAVDNSNSADVFYYNVDNEQVELAAGQTREHSSIYPLLIRFDRGGEEGRKWVTEKNARLQVAVNSADGLWDLYPEDAEIQATAQAAKASRGDTKSSKTNSRAARLRKLLLTSQLE